MEPNKGNIKLWIEALRSGKYKQIRHRLATSEGYCCLGVACFTAKQNGVGIDVSTDGLGRLKFDGERLTLPESVKKWLGITRSDPVLLHGISASGWNDNLAASFSKIADMIEEEYIGQN